MTKYAPPSYSRVEVNRAGRRLADSAAPMELDSAIAIIHDWRLAHNKPLNGMYMSIKRRALQMSRSSVIAQRLKRLESIQAKLVRGEVEKLTQIQDIGGCRVVFPTLANVKAFATKCCANSKTFEFNNNPKDYIAHPKATGYRSYHVVYHYVSAEEAYSGLKIELQLRTKLQHMWATAVETVSTFNRLPLKSGGVGADTDWSRFFALASGAFAAWEVTERVPNTPEDSEELKRELRALAINLRVTYMLNAWRTALNVLPVKKITGTTAYMLTLDVSSNTFSYVPISEKELPAAEERRLQTERTTGNDVVIVRVGSMASLKKAYPNYFADTRDFLAALHNTIGRDV